jgi:hypothetical protein
MSKRRTSAARATDEDVLEGHEASLLDILDNVLTKGVVVTGDLVLGVADVDLVYLRVSAILCAADRVLGPRAKTRDAAAAARKSVAPRTIAGHLGVSQPPKARARDPRR